MLMNSVCCILPLLGEKAAYEGLGWVPSLEQAKCIYVLYPVWTKVCLQQDSFIPAAAAGTRQ